MRLPVIVIFLLITFQLHGQAISVDSNKTIISNGCIYFREQSNQNYRNDSMLYEFYKQIEFRQGAFFFCNFTNDSSLRKLLDISQANGKRACLLPFLRLIDSSAEIKYRDNCKISPRIRFPFYCSEKPIQFLVLFYLEFYFRRKFKVKNNLYIKSIQLVKTKNQPDQELVQEDYDRIFKLYRSSLVHGDNPLKHSNYKWVVKLEKNSMPTTDR